MPANLFVHGSPRRRAPAGPPERLVGGSPLAVKDAADSLRVSDFIGDFPVRRFSVKEARKVPRLT
jgi:hypothetical protein